MYSLVNVCVLLFFVQDDGITINFCEYECYNGRVLPLLLTGLGFSYLVLLQVIAFVLAVVTRNVKIKVLNDSKEMAIIIYTTSVVLLVLGIVTFGLSSYLIVTETLFNGGVILATTVVVFFLFVPKVGNPFCLGIRVPRYSASCMASMVQCTVHAMVTGQALVSGCLKPIWEAALQSSYFEARARMQAAFEESGSTILPLSSRLIISFMPIKTSFKCYLNERHQGANPQRTVVPGSW